MKQKGIKIILTAVSAVVLLAGCKENVGTPEDNAVVEEPEEDNQQTEGGRLIGLSCPDLEDPFYYVLKECIKTELEEQGDQILVQSAGGDAGQQTEQIVKMIDSGIDALVIWPTDPEALDPALEALDKAGIPVVDLGVRLKDAGSAEAFIGIDDSNAGRVCAEDLKEKKPDGGTLVIVDSPDSISVNERITGFEEKIANSGFEVVERINAGSGTDTVKSRMAQTLSDNPKLDAVMCGSDQMALEVLEALEEAGQENVLVYSVGGSPEVKTVLAEPGSPMAGVGALSPIHMGKQAGETVIAVLEGGDYEKEFYVETFFIGRENVEVYGTDGWQ